MKKNYKIDSKDEIADKLGYSTDKIDYSNGFAIYNLRDLGITAPFHSPKFRPDSFAIMVVKNGHGTSFVDDVSYPIAPLYIRFANMFRILQFILEEMDGMDEIYIVKFDEAFVKRYVSRFFYQDFPFLLYDHLLNGKATESEYSVMESIYMLMLEEYKKTSPNYALLGNYLSILLYKFKEKFGERNLDIIDDKSMENLVINFKFYFEKNFQEILQGKTQTILKSNDYADLLNVNLRQLNKMIKSKTGKTVAVNITDRVIEETKILLKESDLSVKEISNMFNYSESTHFTHFFKKATGFLPNHYRGS